MGYGLPGSIGAKVAKPDCQVINIDRDASFNIKMAELSRAARYKITAKVICSNYEMGIVMDLRRLYYEERVHHTQQRMPNLCLLERLLASPPKSVGFHLSLDPN